VYLDSFKLDLVILDLYINGFHGWNLLEEVKFKHPDMPVLIVTAYDNFMNDPRAIKADAYIIKNFQNIDLIGQKVRDLLSWGILWPINFLDNSPSNKGLNQRVSGMLFLCSIFWKTTGWIIMEPITKTLINRLVDKGVEIRVIPALMRDAINTISNSNQAQNLKELNRRIQFLGWYDFELDEQTFQLIVANAETQSLTNIE
jgi:CheY-like chemotaxis protein